MALRVWLPLNGNLDNNGLSTVTVTNNGATVNDSGKIGKCYQFNSTPIYGTLNGLSGWNKFSASCWVYLPQHRGSQYMFHFGGQDGWKAKFGVYTAATTGNIYLLVNGVEVNSQKSLSVNTWNHITVTFDGSKLILYLNGVSAFSYTATSTFSASDHFAIGARTNSTSGTTFNYPILDNGKLNDIRIYDHCLSPREVKEISRGLVLHYKLDDPYIEPTVNLFSGKTDFTSSMWRKGGGPQVESNGDIIVKGSGGTGQCYIANASYPVTISPNTRYTLSFNIKFLDDNANFVIFFYERNSSGAVKTTTKTISSSNIGCWQKAVFTITTQSTTDRMYAELNAYHTTSGVRIVIQNNSIQLEAKDHATPYTPSIRGANTQYDKNVYIEPDGTKWAHIAHHNNPAAGVFSSGSNWASGVYVDSNRWFDVYGTVSQLNSYEFMVKQKITSSQAETKYRWIQSKSPLLATYNDVLASAVTRITTTGYTDGGWGGLYISNNNTHMAIATNASTNWFGAIGSWGAWNGGIPGYPKNAVTSGYLDLYVRIDSLFPVYDCSGYKNDGTINGTLTLSDDSPRYGKSTVFNGAQYMRSTTLNLTGREQLTLAFWCYSTNGNLDGVITIKQDGEAGYHQLTLYDSGLSYRDTNHPNSGGVDTITFEQPTANTWTHYVITYDRGSWYIYKTGTLIKSQTSATPAKLQTANYSEIGRYISSGVGHFYSGKLSDFRIYSTALSADDVKELYNTSALIHNDGTIEAFEFVETNSGSPEITKTGLVKAQSHNEVLMNGLQQYEYLQSTGTQWIDTKYHSTVFPIRIETEALFDVSTEVDIIGNYPGLVFGYWSNKPFVYAGTSGSWALDNSLTVNEFHKLDVTYKSATDYTLIVDGEEYTKTNGNGNATNILQSDDYAIFKGGKTYSSYPYKGKIKYVRIYGNNVLVRNFIPCKYNGAYGMWDTVENKFYSNSGSGSFTAGGEMSPVTAIYTNKTEANQIIES